MTNSELTVSTNINGFRSTVMTCGDDVEWKATKIGDMIELREKISLSCDPVAETIIRISETAFAAMIVAAKNGDDFERKMARRRQGPHEAKEMHPGAE